MCCARLVLTENDFIVRVSDRDAWLAFLAAKNVDAARAPEFLAIVDKIERERPEELDAKLAALGLTAAEVREFIASPGVRFEKFNALAAELDARGFRGFTSSTRPSCAGWRITPASFSRSSTVGKMSARWPAADATIISCAT